MYKVTEIKYTKKYLSEVKENVRSDFSVIKFKLFKVKKINIKNKRARDYF